MITSERRKLVNNTRELTEIALFAAFGIILDFLSGLITGSVWIFGGSISLGVVPIFIASFRRGLKAGLLTGFIVGILQLIIGEPYIVHPIQFILDYLLAYTAVGLSGLMVNNINERKIILGIFIGMCSRFFMHFLAGVVFFSEFAGSQPVIIYSFVYNSTFLIPTLILSILIILAIFETNSEIFEIHG